MSSPVNELKYVWHIKGCTAHIEVYRNGELLRSYKKRFQNTAMSKAVVKANWWIQKEFEVLSLHAAQMNEERKKKSQEECQVIFEQRKEW